MDVFKATSVEIMAVPPLIMRFLSTVEYELVPLGEDLDWLRAASRESYQLDMIIRHRFIAMNYTIFRSYYWKRIKH